MASEPVVHIIDDDEAVRASLSFLFAMSGIPALTYDGPSAFLAAAGALADGCIVTDVRMPEMNGLELMRRVRAMGVDLPVIVMTGHGDVPLAVEAMKAGASDFLEKPFDDEDLLSAVKAALAPSDSSDAELRRRLDELSARERQVLDGLVLGHANKVIARELGISDRTVEIYRAKVMTKMAAESFAELVRLALKAGVSVQSSDHASD
ncbi:MAG TPA: response regulator FixJ [Caulobacteraceae bacterium]|nr:response regulator FixJ [Caulobacteraceae bacterium]